MNAFRKLILTCVAALALVAPIAVTSQADAAGTPVKEAQAHYYYVYYRSCPNDYWHVYGWYYRASDAQYAVRWFQYYGYQAFYR